MKRVQRIGILTGGGDAPGLNAVIRAVTKTAIIEHGMEVVGIEDGFEGVMLNKFHLLQKHDVSGILTLGGTILGTSNKTNPYKYFDPKHPEATLKDLSKKALRNFAAMKIDCLVCIGGDGTMRIASRLFEDGLPVVGVPKTIDNDIIGTDVTFGFDTAVEIATEAIDRIHTTAMAHHRVMIVELMGRTAGWITLHAGVAGGGDILLIPEIPYFLDVICDKVKERSKKGKRFSIVVVSEGARPVDGNVVVKKIVQDPSQPVRLGGISFLLADQIEARTGLEARAVVLGHLQRGGTPSGFDRVLATQLGVGAVDLMTRQRFGYMVGVQGGKFVDVPFNEVSRGARLIPPDHVLIAAARSVGTCFGDR
ncbi:MAG: ATP-dependent 6-phosphofructokinase [Candidatus Omnitrophica bacterium]|nr:ATP-dependent 6-phosphofructokinase [Candidatus Omnitrophota bacterium]